MSMIGNVRAVSDEVIDRLLANPEDVHGVVHPEEVKEDGDYLYLDKSWHAIHYVLAGDTWGGDFPWGFLVSCGTPIGEEDVGYGPARAFRAEEVALLAPAIASIDEANFRSRFSVERMKEADIYPSFGAASDEEELPYFLENFRHLRTFLQRAVSLKKGIIVYVD